MLRSIASSAAFSLRRFSRQAYFWGDRPSGLRCLAVAAHRRLHRQRRGLKVMLIASVSNACILRATRNICLPRPREHNELTCIIGKVYQPLAIAHDTLQSHTHRKNKVDECLVARGPKHVCSGGHSLLASGRHLAKAGSRVKHFYSRVMAFSSEAAKGSENFAPRGHMHMPQCSGVGLRFDGNFAILCVARRLLAARMKLSSRRFASHISSSCSCGG